MERIFSSELLRMLGILGLGGISLMAIMGKYISKIQGTFQPYLKATVIYLLLAALLFGILGFAGIESLFFWPIRSYVVLQFIFVMLGVVHLYMMPHYLGWSTKEKAFPYDEFYQICKYDSSLFPPIDMGRTNRESTKGHEVTRRCVEFTRGPEKPIERP